MPTGHDLMIADERVAHGERVVARQRAIIADLEAQGHDTADAEDSLEIFERSLEEYRRHAAELEGAALQKISPQGLAA